MRAGNREHQRGSKPRYIGAWRPQRRLRQGITGFVLSALLAGILSAQACGAPAPAGPAPAGGAAADRGNEAPSGHQSPLGGNPHLWKPRVTSVAVFKNGLGFFMREGEVSFRDGWCLSKEIPPAAFGTLAIFAHDGDKMVDIVGSGPGEVADFDGADAPKDLPAKRARLEASTGLKVQLTYKKEGTDRSAAGTLRDVGETFVVLESESNSFAVPLAEIQRMQVLELPIRVHVTAEGNKSPQRGKLGMAYLRKGLTWIPEYTLQVLDEETAELTLRGTLVNEAEDLIHCDVNFVVGVPHFVHTDYMAPIAVGQVIRAIGSAVAPREVQTQIASRAALVSNLRTADQFDVIERPVAPPGGDVGAVLGNLPRLEGPGGTDYTVYARKDLTVRRGEKAIVTLFRKRVRYSHLYRWMPPARMEHYFVLHNATDTAWTTGPCLLLSQGSPLGEDLLKYTPAGGSGEIQVTAAVNIAHEQSESEIERKLKAHSPSPDFYLDLVTLKGELKIRNFEKRPVEIVVTANVPGRPLEASDGGAITIDTRNLKLLERSGSVRWRIELEPGKTKVLSYTYERYVPSR